MGKSRIEWRIIKMENVENVNVNEGVETTTTEEVKTYSQEEVLALLQSETDKRVNQALAKQQKKYGKHLKNSMNLIYLQNKS